MSGRQNLGHGKQRAAEIRRDAVKILRRVKAGETLEQIAADYNGCHWYTLKKHVQAVVGIEPWKKVVKRGNRKGVPCRIADRMTEEPIAKNESPPGAMCWYCGKVVAPDTWKCPNCGNLLQG